MREISLTLQIAFFPQNFDRMMASPTPPSGSLSGILDEGNNAMDQEESRSGNVVGAPLRSPGGLMYADLQVGAPIVSNLNQCHLNLLNACPNSVDMYRVAHLLPNPGWVDFELGCSNILANWSATSTNFPSAQPELGRGWKRTNQRFARR